MEASTGQSAGVRMSGASWDTATQPRAGKPQAPWVNIYPTLSWLPLTPTTIRWRYPPGNTSPARCSNLQGESSAGGGTFTHSSESVLAERRWAHTRERWARSSAQSQTSSHQTSSPPPPQATSRAPARSTPLPKMAVLLSEMADNLARGCSAVGRRPMDCPRTAATSTRNPSGPWRETTARSTARSNTTVRKRRSYSASSRLRPPSPSQRPPRV
mmetsp:Transcript_36631/g.91347  ORF Transcript_36631/g.91347 Transcript_36631/m.91347 type:complete len:214 (-) Transcript_36631:565-1206(-)